MKINKYEKFNILMALVFAVFMLVTAFLMRGSEYKQTAIMLLIALWFTIMGFIKNKSTSCQSKK